MTISICSRDSCKVHPLAVCPENLARLKNLRLTSNFPKKFSTLDSLPRRIRTPTLRPSRPHSHLSSQWLPLTSILKLTSGPRCRGGQIQQLLPPSLPRRHHHQHWSTQPKIHRTNEQGYGHGPRLSISSLPWASIPMKFSIPEYQLQTTIPSPSMRHTRSPVARPTTPSTPSPSSSLA